MIGELLKRIYSSRADLPVRRGEVMIENFNSTGINVVFTRSVDCGKIATKSGE